MLLISRISMLIHNFLTFADHRVSETLCSKRRQIEVANARKRINKNQKRIAYRETYLNFDGKFSFFCQQIIHSIYSFPGAMIQPELYTQAL